MKIDHLEEYSEPTPDGQQSSALRYRVPLDLGDLNNSHTLAVLSTPPASRVLDVGCGPGVVAGALAKRRCSVWGIEADAVAARVARPYCERVIVSDVERLDFSAALPSERFDVVLLLDVLEHLREPANLLQRLSPLVKESGVVLASIPNVAHGAVRLALLSGRFRYSETGLLDQTHLRFFDEATMNDLFQEAGYTIQSRLRVVRDLDQTEIAIDLGSYPDGVVSDLRRDPLALTYQFFVTARPRRTTQADSTEADSGQMLAERYQARIIELEAIVRQHEEVRQQAEAYARHVEQTLVQREQDLDFLKRDAQIKENDLAEMRSKLENADAEIKGVRDAAARQLSDALEEARRLTEHSKVAEAELHREIARRQNLVDAMAATRTWRLRGIARRLFGFASRTSGSEP